MDLALSTRPVAGYTLLSVGGEIDVYTAADLRARLSELTEQTHTRIIIDLTDVGFLDSTGLGVLVGAQKKSQQNGGELRLVCSSERILKIFHITGLHKVFRIFDSIDDATATIDQ